MRPKTKNNTTYANARKRPRGFALLGLLIFIPVLLTILIGLGSAAHWMTRYTEKQSVCENQIFSLQHSLSEKLNSLFNLNPEARALRAAYNLALIKLLAAIASYNAPAVAAAEANLIKIQQQKNQLQSRQSYILGLMKIIAARRALSIRNELTTNNVTIRMPKMQIRPETSTEVAPPYVTLFGFRTKQTATINYTLEESTFGCKATIENREGIFRATLVEAGK